MADRKSVYTTGFCNIGNHKKCDGWINEKCTCPCHKKKGSK